MLNNDNSLNEPDGIESPLVTSRYAEFEGVEIDPMKVPASFRHLLPSALYWSIGDDIERIRLMRATTVQELYSLVDAVVPFDDEIWNWCLVRRCMTPVPHEVVIFDRLLQAAAEAKKMLE